MLPHLNFFSRYVGNENSHETNILPPFGLVRDGTPCGENQICMNRSCVATFVQVPQERCPTNDLSLECSGHGVGPLTISFSSSLTSCGSFYCQHCTNENKCFCETGYNGTDCSIASETTPTPPSTATPATTNKSVEVNASNMKEHMKKKETPYGT